MSQIILDYGVNHEGNIDYALLACETVAKECKELNDIMIKFQCYNPLELSKPANFQLHLSQYEAVAKKCKELKLRWGVSLFKSTWNKTEYFINLGCSFIKIATIETRRLRKKGITNIIQRVRTLNKKIAIYVSIPIWFNSEYYNLPATAFLVCKSIYPCSDPLSLLEQVYHFQIGYSDHAVGYFPCLIAEKLGASVIEKHFTLQHHQSKFRDHSEYAVDPQELREWMSERKRI